MLRTCIDRLLPLTEEVDAAARAVEERPRNVPMWSLRQAPSRHLLPFLAIDTDRYWRARRTLGVGFAGGSRWQREAVQRIAPEWSDSASVSFDFSQEAADIRVGFEPDLGSWSYVGTDAQGIDASLNTMNLAWIDRSSTEDQIRGVILHEFGHALGCLHEHQSPASGIPWDRDRVYAHYAGRPNFWDPPQVEANVIATYDSTKTKFSQFDPQSIMVYPIPEELTIGDFRVDPTYSLSRQDKEFVARIYPEIEVIIPVAVGSTVAGGLRHEMEEDQFSIAVEVDGSYVIETAGPTNVRLALYGPDRKDRVIAADDDSGHDRYNARILPVLIRGQYWLRIRHQADLPGEYSLTVRQA